MLPPGGPLFLIVGGLVLGRRLRRVGNAMAGFGALLLYLLSTPLASAWLVQLASGHAPPVDREAARNAQAIVILGGGVRKDAPEYGGDSLARLSLERIRYGAAVARDTGLPVLVSGGSVRGDTRAEAHLMRDALQKEFSLPVRWVEDRSSNTRQNAENSARLLRESGVTRIVLVVHAFDVPRARQEFERHGLAVIPAPTMVPKVELDSLADLLPSAGAMYGAYYAIYELLAQAVPALRG